MTQLVCLFSGCQKTSVSRGFCGTHYARLRKHGSVDITRPGGRRKTDQAILFWSHVNKTDTCWIWTAYRDKDGYGRFGNPNIPAHRWAYQSLNGPIPNGLTLDHLCRVPACVNPAHLEPVSSRLNTLRGIGISANNATKTHCKNGHEFNATNTRITVDGTRRCRICARDEMRRRRSSANGPL